MNKKLIPVTPQRHRTSHSDYIPVTPQRNRSHDSQAIPVTPKKKDVIPVSPLKNTVPVNLSPQDNFINLLAFHCVLGIALNTTNIFTLAIVHLHFVIFQTIEETEAITDIRMKISMYHTQFKSPVQDFPSSHPNPDQNLENILKQFSQSTPPQDQSIPNNQSHRNPRRALDFSRYSNTFINEEEEKEEKQNYRTSAATYDYRDDISQDSNYSSGYTSSDDDWD
jgi:hypothetical protein